jgi:hypothetical protein
MAICIRIELRSLEIRDTYCREDDGVKEILVPRMRVEGVRNVGCLLHQICTGRGYVFIECCLRAQIRRSNAATGNKSRAQSLVLCYSTWSCSRWW